MWIVSLHPECFEVCPCYLQASEAHRLKSIEVNFDFWLGLMSTDHSHFSDVSLAHCYCCSLWECDKIMACLKNRIIFYYDTD